MRHREKWLFGALVLLFLLMAVVYTRVTPLGQAPDELSHLGYVSNIAFHLQLPLAATPERQQPPLFYLLGAAILRISGDPRLVRLVSVVCGAAAVITVYLAAHRLFPGRRLVPVGAAAVFALLPEVQYLSGAVSDDSLAWLMGALLLLMVIEVMQRAVLTRRLLVGAGVLIGAALLAKETVWVLAVLLAVVIVVRHGRRLLRPADVLCLSLPVVVIAGWWFIRNVATFHSLTPPLAPITNHFQMLSSLSQVRGFLAATALSAVGMYGNGQHLEAVSLLGVHALPSAVAGALALSAAVVVAVAAWRSWPRWDAKRRWMAAVLGVALVAVGAQFVINAVILDVQPQSRYLMVAAVVAASALAWALAGVLRRAVFPVACLLVVVALVFDASGLLTVSRLVA